MPHHYYQLLQLALLFVQIDLFYKKLYHNEGKLLLLCYLSIYNKLLNNQFPPLFILSQNQWSI